MDKKSFVTEIASRYNCSKIEAKKVINMFTSSVTSALSEGEDIFLVGFGKFSVSQVAAREGRDPRTGEIVKIATHKQPKFKPAPKLKKDLMVGNIDTQDMFNVIIELDTIQKKLIDIKEAKQVLYMIKARLQYATSRLSNISTDDQDRKVRSPLQLEQVLMKEVTPNNDDT